MEMHPKYIWYYIAGILLIYFIWNYYSIHPNNHFGSTSLLNNNDMSDYELMQHEPSTKMSFSSFFNNLQNSQEPQNVLKNNHSNSPASLDESNHTLSNQLNVPNYQSNSFESQIVNDITKHNLMTTPNYALSKSHILLERQLSTQN